MHLSIRTLFLGLCGVVAATSLPLFAVAEAETDTVQVVVVITSEEDGTEVPVLLQTLHLAQDVGFQDRQLATDDGDEGQLMGMYMTSFREHTAQALSNLPLSERTDVEGMSALESAQQYVAKHFTPKDVESDLLEVSQQELALHLSSYGGEVTADALRRTAQVSQQELGAIKVLVRLNREAFLRLQEEVQSNATNAAYRSGRIDEALGRLTNHINGILLLLIQTREDVAATRALITVNDRRLTRLEQGLGAFASLFGWVCQGLKYGAKWLAGAPHQDGNPYHVYPSLRDGALASGVGGYTTMQVILNLPILGPLLKKIPGMKYVPTIIIVVNGGGAVVHTLYYRPSDDTITWKDENDRKRTGHRTDITASIGRRVNPFGRRRRLQQNADEQV